MSTPRFDHTATLLQHGNVLVAGGTGSLNTEIYNPTLGTWSLTGSLNAALTYHTATLLPNGTVLAAGGTTGANATASTEIFYPGPGN
jgi:N-acetylneuraminic acid mutarotase